MPPKQCPECGRFLKKELVSSLRSGPQPCPRCDQPLEAHMFSLEGAAGDPPPETVADPAAPATADDAGDSVRPPDLEPDAVRDAGQDPLAGWDPQGPPPVIDRAPPPVDAAVLAGAGLAGAVLGSLFGERGCRGAVLGALGGVLGAGAARRVWELE